MHRILFWTILISLFLFGCREVTPTPPPPEEILSRAVARLYETTGLHFIIERSGAPAYLDLGKTLSLRRMDGDFVSPDRIQATVRIITTGFVTDIKIIGIGDIQWETNPLSGRWQQLPPNWGFNPTSLFDPSMGFQPILEDDLEDLQYLGFEELEAWPGEMFYSLTGTIRGNRIFKTTYGMIGPDKLDLQLWIALGRFEIVRIVIVDESGEAQEPTIWTIDFGDYDHLVEIEPPLLSNTPTP